LLRFFDFASGAISLKDQQQSKSWAIINHEQILKQDKPLHHVLPPIVVGTGEEAQ